MKKSILAAISISFILNSCVYSLFPIYTKETLVIRKDITGSWVNENTQVNFALNSEDSKTYTLTVKEIRRSKDEAKHYSYDAHIVKIGDALYLDLYPSKNDDHLKDTTRPLGNFFPVHTFFKLEIEKDKIKFIHFNLEKLNDLFQQNKIRLRHEVVEDEILITARPQEIQKFIENYASEPNVFSDEEVLYKL